LLWAYAKRPFSTGLSPVTILQLLSMRFDAVRFSQTRVGRDVRVDPFAPRRLAELFVPGLSERAQDDLLPEPWTAQAPVRLVTARTILLAGMASFVSNHRQAVDLVRSASAYVSHRGFHPLLASLCVAGEL